MTGDDEREPLAFDDEGFVDSLLAQWETHRAASIGCRVQRPADWLAFDISDNAVVLAAPPMAGSSGRSNLNIVVLGPEDLPPAIAGAPAPAPAGGEPPDAARLHVATLEAGFDEALVLECELATVGGRPATRALVAYVDGDHELTLEQWLVARPDGVVALSATAQTLDYPYDWATFRRIVDSLAFDD